MADKKAEKAEKAEAKAEAKAKAAAAKEEAKAETKPAGVAAGSPGDPTDHSVSASEMAASTDPSKKTSAAATAVAFDKAEAASKDQEAADAAEVDNSIVGKIRRSGLYFVRDHSTGLDYVGESPQNDPKATDASKLRSSVMPLDMVSPRTGMQIRVKDGDSFSVPQGFGPDMVPADWAKVLTPSGDSLFA